MRKYATGPPPYAYPGTRSEGVPRVSCGAWSPLGLANSRYSPAAARTRQTFVGIRHCDLAPIQLRLLISAACTEMAMQTSRNTDHVRSARVGAPEWTAHSELLIIRLDT